ncbi:olfactory receptor 1S1-like [Pelobates fuscus]|uniref:olfactory receptor 1S1-like n=1 Tax=Pelobates fuscus TaxID=191477 RepID=UPI002FE467D0
MCEDNQTTITNVFLLGFPNFQKFKFALFVLFLVIFLVILIGNIFVISVMSISHCLRHPMYLFIKNLALADILFTSNLLPQLLYVILFEGGHISVAVCILQYYFHSFLVFAQCFILTVMSYDRYLAIRKPLQYSSVMNANHSLLLVYLSWVLAFIFITSEIILVYQLHFCSTNLIDHFFCDIGPLLQLSSSDTSILALYDLMISVIGVFFPFTLVITSYACIVNIIIKISSKTGRQKAFSTCSSHLIIVCIYYGTVIAIYVLPSLGNSATENKFKSLIYTNLTPFINPFVYSLRNKEILRILKNLFRRIWINNE